VKSVGCWVFCLASRGWESAGGLPCSSGFPARGLCCASGLSGGRSAGVGFLPAVGLTRSREAAKGGGRVLGVMSGGMPAAHPGTSVFGSPAGAFVARAFQPEICAVRLGCLGIAALVRVLCGLLGSREAAKPRRESHGCEV